MKCRRFKERIILYFYNELNDEEKAQLEVHIKKCHRCSQEFTYTQKVLAALDETREEEIRDVNWEKSWKAIDSHIRQTPTLEKSFFLFPRWAYAAAAVLIIFIGGIVIGRFWIPFPGKPAIQPAGSQSYAEHTLKQYLEELKPVLIEYANTSASERGEETILMDKRIAGNLIIQNLLLKSIVAKSNPTLVQFLDDVDLVLKEIANLKSEDKQTPSMIKELIHEREILFKMEILQKL